jgi:hypothetical protein
MLQYVLENGGGGGGGWTWTATPHLCKKNCFSSQKTSYSGLGLPTRAIIHTTFKLKKSIRNSSYPIFSLILNC